MNRKALYFISIAALALTLVSGTVFLAVSHKNDKSVSAESDNSKSDFTYITPQLQEEEEENDTEDVIEPKVDKVVTSFVPATKIDLNTSSITLYVNREYPLPKEYKPEDLVRPNVAFDLTSSGDKTLMRSEAAKALEKLFRAAQKDGITLIGVSAYRSYDRQFKIFTNNMITKGQKHTFQYSAIPGTSEHQTGLSIDISGSTMKNKLTDAFADTMEGAWVAKNSYKYGYIIRYPKDKADITGYAYEPWHIRYVGRGLAYYLHTNNLTLDEYYKYTPSPDFDFEKVYADIINYAPPTRPPVVKATPTVNATPTLAEPQITEKPKPGSDNKNPTVTPGGKTNTHTGTTPVPTPDPNSGNTENNPPVVTEAPQDNTGSDQTGKQGTDGTDGSNSTAEDMGEDIN